PGANEDVVVAGQAGPRIERLGAADQGVRGLGAGACQPRHARRAVLVGGVHAAPPRGAPARSGFDARICVGSRSPSSVTGALPESSSNSTAIRTTTPDS